MRYRLCALFLLAVSSSCPLKADLIRSIEIVKPSLVIVGAFKTTDNPRFSLRGTGFVIASTKMATSNLAITNAHVLLQVADEGAGSALVIQIRSANNEWQMRRATVLEVDRQHDLALLQFDGLPSHGLSVGDSSSVKEGQTVAFMGFPIGGALGFSPVTHRGMVSAITPAAIPTPSAQQLNELAIRSLRIGAAFNVFQLDGTAYPGNSGGPLFDPDTGDVLGIVNMVFVKGARESALSNPSGISYAIPSGYILPLMQRRMTP
jgi:S1-C subfamily serine protease